MSLIAQAIFVGAIPTGGTAPYVNTDLSRIGERRLFLVDLIAVSGLRLVAGLLIPETRTVELDRPATGRLSN